MNIDCIFLGTSLIFLTFLVIGLFAYTFIFTIIKFGIFFVNLIIALFVFTVFVYIILDASNEINKCLKNSKYKW